MNTQLVTTGLVPLCVGSSEVFQARSDLDGLYWDLTGGTATLTLVDPGGNSVNVPATIGPDGAPKAPWTVTGPAGDWRRAWRLQDASGVVQVSRPIAFTVVVSP